MTPRPYNPDNSKTPNRPRIPGTTSPRQSDAICRDPKIDAITTMGDGATYVFKGPNYYKLTDTSIASGYPKRIEDEFGVPGFLDAVFTWTNDKTYCTSTSSPLKFTVIALLCFLNAAFFKVFKGKKYWRLTRQTLDSGYPKDISDGFEGSESLTLLVPAWLIWNGNLVLM